MPDDGLEVLDFIELNGKDMAEDRQKTQNLTHSLGKSLSKPVAAGGDYISVITGVNDNETTDMRRSTGVKMSCAADGGSDKTQGGVGITYETVVLEYSPKAKKMVKTIKEASDQMAARGLELIAMNTTASAKGILVFRKREMR